MGSTAASSSSFTSFEVEPAAGSLGAYLHGLDCSRPLTAHQVADLHGALARHLVVFLPDQDLTLEQLERLTDELGGCDVTPFVRPVDGHPHVIRVVKEAGDELNFANAWHSDLSYLPEPPAYTLLHAWDVPAAGGDTVWANQQLAFATLSAGLQTTLRTLQAVHSAGMAYGTGGYLESVKDRMSMAIEPSKDAYRSQVHPMVTVHPLSGREQLYVNPTYTTRISGWSPAESQAVLAHLYRHSVHENLTCRLRWKPRMLAIWDNRSTQHNALNDYAGVRRELVRTSVRGHAPHPA